MIDKANSCQAVVVVAVVVRFVLVIVVVAVVVLFALALLCDAARRPTALILHYLWRAC